MRLINNLLESRYTPEELIRELAKSDYWQSVFANLKENPLIIFDNKREFSNLQLMFLSYLNFFHSISVDVMMGEVSKLVWEKEIYADAYMKYKAKKMYKDKDEQKGALPKSVSKKTNERKVRDKWLFNKKR